MATGVLSIAALRDGLPWLSTALFALAGCAAAALVVWACRFGLRDESGGYETFAVVAALNVLAIRSALWHAPTVAACLGVIAAAVFVWAAPRLARSNRQASFAGIALLLVVAVESLAEVAARLSADWTGAALADLALALWLSGVVLYALLVVRVGPALWPARSPDSITPDWWIVMGALSIVTVSGGWVFMQVDTAIAPSLLLATWIGATLWLPLLAVAEVRRTRRIRPFWRYQPGAWSAVFPIGMYALACSWVGTLEGVGALRVVSQIGLGVGVAAWSLTVVGGAQPRFRPGALSPGLVEQRPGNQPGSDSS